MLVFFVFILCLSTGWFALFPPDTAHAQEMLPFDQSALTILSYNAVGDDAFPSTNLRIEQFDAHLQEILSGEYNVLSLKDALRTLENKEPLPSKAIAITFEGAHSSAFRNAMPKLIEHNIPFTIFYAANAARGTTGKYMSRKDLLSLSNEERVTFGILPSSYSHPTVMSEKQFRRELNDAKDFHRHTFQEEPLYFSYAFGEYTQEHQTIIQGLGFEAALTLNSAVAHQDTDRFALPRFTMTENFGDLSRFRLVSNAAPLPIRDLVPAQSILDTDQPAIGFTIDRLLQNQADALSCFVSGIGRVDTQIIGNRVEIRTAAPLEDERTRLNCTLPVAVEENIDTPVWRWFGILMLPPSGQSTHAKF